MPKAQPRRNKPRIRKTAPTVREQIEVSSKQSDSASVSRKTRASSRPFRALSGFLTPVLRPFTPIWRFIKRVLRRLVPSYFVNSWREVRLVTWPSRKETWRLTGAVFIFALVFGALVAVVDKGLDEIFKKVILK